MVYATVPVSSVSTKTRNINTAAYYLFNGTEWIQLNVCGFINSLNCENSTNQGTLTEGTIVSGVSSSIPYTGGNGGVYSQQSFSSTGVTGLTATLNAGALAEGNGSLTFTITGTPNGSGIASFDISIGGQKCTLTRLVEPKIKVDPKLEVTSLNCENATHYGTLTEGYNSIGGYTDIPYTGGIEIAYPAQTFNSTGVTGISITLVAGTLASGIGTLRYIYTGTPSSSGTATFTITFGGKTCTFTRTVNAKLGTVPTLNCESATHQGTLTDGTTASGVSSSIPYTEGDGRVYSQQSFSSTGVTGLTATLNEGTLAEGNGSLTFTITGTPNGSGIASFDISIGGEKCTLTRLVEPKIKVDPKLEVASLNCERATHYGTLTEGYNSIGGYTDIPYTGGIEIAYPAQTFNSTGVTGISITLVAGTLASGIGTLRYIYTGTPSSSGTATFTITFGGKTCTFTRIVNAKLGTVSTLNCESATHQGTLTDGTTASEVSSSIPYTEGDGRVYSQQSVNSTGVTGLTATLNAGRLENKDGSLTYTITGTPNGIGTADFNINVLEKCTFSRTVNPKQLR